MASAYADLSLPPRDTFADAHSALAATGVAALTDMFACLARDPTLLDQEQGRRALIDMLICIVQALAQDRITDICAVMATCDPTTAAAGRALLLDALAEQGQTDAATFDHPTILCLAVLSAAADCPMLSSAGDA